MAPFYRRPFPGHTARAVEDMLEKEAPKLEALAPQTLRFRLMLRELLLKAYEAGIDAQREIFGEEK